MMRLCSKFLILTVLGLVGFCSTGQGAEHIHDNLNLFSKATVETANQQIDQLYQDHKLMIAVETRTAPAIPAAIQGDEQAINRFISSWAEDQYKQHKLHGVYLVILKNPSKYRFQVGTDLLKQQVVRQTDIDLWSKTLTQHLRDKDYDAALADSVTSISTRLAANVKSSTMPIHVNAPLNQPRVQNNDGLSIGTWLLIGVGVFLLFGVLRSVIGAISNRAGSGGMPNQYGPGNQPGYGGMGGGGGFMTSMLGGLFGAAAGNWMYDRMSGGNQAHGSDGHFTSHSDGSSFADNSSSDSESTSFGGDWGNDSGGGGFGGGDFGGGDFGGGDSGGGGGDW